MANPCPWGVGAKTKTLIAFEQTYGVLPSTVAAVVLPINTNSVQKTQNMTDAATITGNRNPTKPIKGNIDVSGDIVIPVDYKAIGYWLKAMFDEPTTTGSEGAYSHVFKIGGGMPSFTLEKAFPGITKYGKMSGCKVSKFSMNTGGDGELTATVSVVGQKETVGASSMDADPTVATMSRAGNFQATVKVGGTLNGKITAFNLDIDFGVDTDGYAIGGNGERIAACDGICTVSGSVEAFYDGTLGTNELTSLELILTGSDDESLSFKLPEVMLAATGTPAIDGPAGIKQTINFNAYYESDSAGSAVVATLANDVEEY